jgi:hypothetical protein
MDCNILLSIFVCGNVILFKGILFWIFHLEGPMLHIAAMLISTALIYMSARLMGKIGGILISVIGVAGALFTGGTSLLLTAFGLIMVFYSNAAKWVALLNIFTYLICLIAGCSV